MNRVITYILIQLITLHVALAQLKSEEILIQNNEIELLGTLTYTQKKTPLLIWVHGSGNVDRNGNQLPVIKANYIKQFRDSVNKYNLAFYSYDKRTAHKKNIESLKKGVVFEDYVADVKKTVQFFKKDKRFRKIILVGHSQGSLVAMLAMSNNINQFISIAGPSNAADQVIIKQIEEKAPFLDSITRAHFKELGKTGKIENVHPMLLSIFKQENQAFLTSWIKYNPIAEIQKITIPTLIVNGKKDIQVQQKDAIALNNAAKNSKLVVIEHMNHVLKEVNSMTENQNSYLNPDFPLSTILIQNVVKFVNQ